MVQVIRGHGDWFEWLARSRTRHGGRGQAIMPSWGRFERSIPFVQNTAASRSVGVGKMAKDQATSSSSDGGAGANELDGEVQVSETRKTRAPERWRENVGRASTTGSAGGGEAQVCS